MNLPDYKKKLAARAAAQSRTASRYSVWFQDVMEYLGPKMKTGELVGAIKRIKQAGVKEVIAQMRDKESNPHAIPIRNRAAYFNEMCKKYKLQLPTQA